MQNQENIPNSISIAERIKSLEKQKSYAERVKKRIEWKLDKEIRNGKRAQYNKALIRTCEETIKCINDKITDLNLARMIYSNFVS